MKLRKLIAPVSILLFLAAIAVGAYYVKKAALERAMVRSMELRDWAMMRSLARSWPPPVDARFPESENSVFLRRGTPLHLAVYETRSDLVQLLLDRGAEVNATNAFDDTPLHLASEGNLREDVAMTRTLLRAGASANVRECSGATPLHKAAWNGATEVVEVLLEAGADINAQDDLGFTPLYNAASHCHRETVALLLKRRADVRVKTKEGETALAAARAVMTYSEETEKERLDLVDLLLSHDAKE